MAHQPDLHPEWPGLLAAAQDGDREAYAAFLEAVTPFLREAARRAAQDPRLAERIVQEALLAIHRLRHTYDPRRPITPWLAGILAAKVRKTCRPEGAWRLSLLPRPTWSSFSTPISGLPRATFR